MAVIGMGYFMLRSRQRKKRRRRRKKRRKERAKGKFLNSVHRKDLEQ